MTTCEHELGPRKILQFFFTFEHLLRKLVSRLKSRSPLNLVHVNYHDSGLTTDFLASLQKAGLLNGATNVLLSDLVKQLTLSVRMYFSFYVHYFQGAGNSIFEPYIHTGANISLLRLAGASDMEVR